MYDWVLSWAHHPAGTYILAVVAFVESSFFPVPPDVLQMAMALSRPPRAFWYALVGTVFSVLGGLFGYAIGYFFYETFGKGIIDFYHLQATFETVGGYYQAGAFFWIFLAAFTPIPYKVFTIAAGVYHNFVPLEVLFIASIVGRGGRFFLTATLIYFFGSKVKAFIDKYFNWLTVAFGILAIAGFLAVKFVS